MLFAIVCTDKPNQAAVRAQHRDAHLTYLDDFADKMLSVGPLLAEDGSHSVGSLLILDFEDRSDAEQFCAGDPFNRAGIFESVVIRPYKQIYPKG